MTRLKTTTIGLGILTVGILFITWIAVSFINSGSTHVMDGVNEPSAKNVDDGEFAAVVRTEERNGKFYDCTMYASGKKCTLVGELESKKLQDRIEPSD